MEEAIAETVAQVATGGRLYSGLNFPIANGYVSPIRVIAEAILSLAATELCTICNPRGYAMRKIINLLRGSQPSISKQESIETARHECDVRGWLWIEPVRAIEGLRAWTIRTNAEGLGASAIIKNDKSSGKVIEAGYIPR